MKRKVLILVVFILLTIPNVINAMYQSRPDGTAVVNTTANDFFINVRKMEAEGQVMGFDEELVSADSPLRKDVVGKTPNEIDVHMTKNTEYGATAILAASQYGQIQSGYPVNDVVGGVQQTQSVTTGNKYGVYQLSNGSRLVYVAGIYGATHEYMSRLKIATESSNTAKYVDLYNNPTNYSNDLSGAKIGDATRETLRWYGASTSNFVYSTQQILARGYAMFSFYSGPGQKAQHIGVRASMVSGAGL